MSFQDKAVQIAPDHSLLKPKKDRQGEEEKVEGGGCSERCLRKRLLR
jgi:hypothetical protein